MPEEIENLLASLESDPPADPTPEAGKSDGEEIKQSGTTDPGEVEPVSEEPGKGDAPQSEAISLKDYAGKHNLDLKDLYALTLSNGQTLHDLNAAGKSLKSLTDDRETFEAESATFRIEQAAAQKEVGELVELMRAGELTPEGVQKLDVLKASALAKEQSALLTVLPEWKDGTAKAADVAEMITHVAAFGLTEQDLGSIADHRWLKYIHFNSKREARAKAVLKVVKKAAPKGKGANSGKAGDKGEITDLAKWAEQFK